MADKDVTIHTLRGDTETQCVCCGCPVWVNSPDETADMQLALFVDELSPQTERGSWNFCDTACAVTMMRMLDSYTRPTGFPTYGYHYNLVQYR